ncbi:MAG: hypothetical protein KGH80_03645 [Xanthomonadaceae bacterium]|nr:hypothetical protein [Xanthomonadaceae bacterium]
MPRCILFLFALIAAPAFAQPFAPDAGKAPPSPEMPPAQVLAQFHHDEINLLALRADAHSLLAAALMAQTDANDPARPKPLQTPALLARAQKATDADALVWWVSAALECRGKVKSCPREETLAQLEKADPSNAAVWLWVLHRGQQTGVKATTRAALTSAAQAARFDDYFGSLAAVLYQAAGILPVEENILRASNQPGVSPAGFKLTSAASVAIALPHPYLDALNAACKDAATDAGLAQDCVAVAQKLADSGSLFARGFGLRLLLQLIPDGAAHDVAAARLRTLAWRMQHIGELGARLADDSRVTGTYMQALSASGRESDAVDAVLHAQGVALEPPADWQPVVAESPAQP